MNERKSFREMEPRERALIHKLLEPDFPGRDGLAQQLETAQVRPIYDPNGSLGFLEFLITSPVRIEKKRGVAVEGEYKDPDGMTVHVLLHVRDGKADCLEFYRDDGQQIQTWPDLSSMEIYGPFSSGT